MLHAGPDLAERKGRLSLIGVRTDAVLTANANREDLERPGEATLNIVPP
jgi:nitrogenase molybdenum-iron protein alpha/beta subunit